MRKPNKPNVSVIIPTYNEGKNIRQCICSLLKQSYKKFEIIIVDDGSTDKTRDIVKSLMKKVRNVKLIEGEHKGPGFSRNLGARKSKSLILVFVDADMTFDKEYLKNIVSPILKKSTFGTEDGRQIASNKNNIWSKCWGAFFKLYTIPAEGYIFRAILKSEFDKMGGFDPKYGYADDLTFYYKFGAKSTRVPQAVCYHKNPETLKEVYKQSVWIGASLDNWLMRNDLIKYFVPFFMFILFPLLIPLFSIKRSYQNSQLKLLIPWMLIFMTARYFGTLKGLINKIYFNKNVR